MIQQNNLTKMGNKPFGFELEGAKKIFDWRSYLYMLKRKKWLIIIPTILGSLAAFYMHLDTVPVYESSTTILVSGGKLLTGSLRGLVPGVTAQDEITGTKNYVMSAQCIAGLIRTLDLKMPPNLQEKASNLARQLPEMKPGEIATMLFIDRVRSYITVASAGRDMIKLSAVHENPQKAYLLTKTLAEVFKEEFQKRQVGGIRGAREFSEEQLAIFKEKLRESEERLKNYQQGLLKNQIQDVNLGREATERIRSDIASLELSVRDKKDRSGVLSQQLASNFTQAQPIETSEGQKGKRKVFGSIDELVKIRGKFSWTDPEILEINDEINVVRDEVRQALSRHVANTFVEKNASARNLLVEWNLNQFDIELLEYEQRGLQKKLRELESKMVEAPSHELTLRHLSEEVERNRMLTERFSQQAQGTQIEEQIQRRDAQFKLQVVEMARKPLTPSNTGMKQKIILAVLPLLGFGLGGGIIFGLDFIDESIKNVDEVQRDLGLPVWGVIPEIEPEETGFWAGPGLTILISVLIAAVGAGIIYLVQSGGLQIFM